MPDKRKHLEIFCAILNRLDIDSEFSGNDLICSSGKKKFTLPIEIHFHLIKDQPQKMASLLQSKLNLNKRVFARNCEVKKISRAIAEDFLNTYHLMNSTQSAFNFGLFHKSELLAVASFSKGRKMDRLPADKRSFELIRFCCKEGISVTGGLTRLVKNFCREKNAGDVMTYVAKQFSEGTSFVKAGFVKYGETELNVKLVYTA